ncbi:MAG: sulfatase-like hydrolase/transferase [Planctomycetota bacterium]|jgi:arylsulfatase A-like enzyme
MTGISRGVAALFTVIAACAGAARGAERPNMLWITSEDNGVKWISCYGGVNTNTPSIDRLAREGFRYRYCFDNAAVCAPTRSTWITGMHAISNGTQPMRSGNEIPESIRYYNELLQEAGYYTSNHTKTDYNIRGRKDARRFWNSIEKYAWRDRKEGQPFFAVINLGGSHESRAHGDPRDLRNDPAKMKLAAYHPDLPEVRRSYAMYADAVEKMDAAVGEILKALKADGLHEDTIVIYNSDHGGVMPRSKRFLYASGIHCPLVVRIPEKGKRFWPAARPGMPVDRLVSFIDMPKTWVSLAGGRMAENLQGTVFLGDGIEEEPKFHFGWRERADDRVDNVRMVRTKRFAYHKNYAPYAPAGQFLAYMFRIIAAPAWEKHHLAGRTTEVTGRFFRPRVSEEFYDNETDFDNVRNLIDDPRYQGMIAEFRRELRRQQLKYFDSGLLPENLRGPRAKSNGMTIYEMVRNPKLYPLEQYLDAADRALARDRKNLAAFIADLEHEDEGMQYWAVIGLLLLEQDARPAAAALEKILSEPLRDRAEEVQVFAIWALYRLGRKERAEEYLHSYLENGRGEKLVYNVCDWMGDASNAVLAKYCSANFPRHALLKDIVDRKGIPRLRPEDARVIPAASFSTGAGGRRRLKAEYFNDRPRGEPVLTRVDANIDFDWKGGSPEGVRKDNFAARWTGKVRTDRGGRYVFVTDIDDGARLWVNGKRIIEGGGTRAGVIELEADTEYDFKMEFIENGGNAIARLKWLLPE